MGVSFIRKTIPSPTTGTSASVSHAPTLVRAMGQRLFENVLRGQGQPIPDSVAAPGEELALMENASQAPNLSGVRAAVQGADPATRQAMITAAYIKASALGSGASPWKTPGVLGTSFRGISGGLSEVPATAALEGPPTEGRTGAGQEGLGSLAARFESGSLGSEAVGYDPGGGTSYGLYQIASRTGTMERFLDFLAVHEPRWAQRLRAAGPADTGGSDGAMPRVWKAIARENPERFAQLQQAFIRETHYEPARRAVEDATGVDLEKASRAVQEALWSASVQHGPGRAADMFIRALKSQGLGGSPVDEAALIHSVYRDRGRSSRFFSGSLREALLRRFQQEKAMVLAMLTGENETTA
ncbi:MAG: hypothetical protein WHS86_14550 [Desulfosoma sp.]